RPGRRAPSATCGSASPRAAVSSGSLASTSACAGCGGAVAVGRALVSGRVLPRRERLGPGGRARRARSLPRRGG
ncbi:MAG TPA: hypothetical protein VKW77_10095, partial [Acidimicrobiales bacterium]|nr:hypothetical protein [Acidimicrobiales bacterium]